MLLLFLGNGLNLLQAQIIRGTVIDSLSNEPLIGATVVEVDQTGRFLNGTITDFNGEFNLKVSSDEVLLSFSFIGYSSRQQVCRASEVLTVFLSSESTLLGEVSIVATGRTDVGDGISNVPIRDLATSVASIEMSKLSKMPTSSVSEALQGRMSGVDITSTSGDPGAGMSIIIRGNTSLNGNSRPLIVLDGVPYETTIGTDFNFANADVADYGSLVDISPADISSIQILKDAASTAVWGSKGSNGVVVINTKRGQNKKTVFALDYRNSYVFEPEPLPMLDGDQYVRLMIDSRFNRNPVGITQIPAEFLNEPGSVDYYNFNRNTSWIDEITRNGLTNDLNFSITGGGDKARYRASVGYYNQSGTTVGTDIERITARLNLDYRISDKLQLSSDFSYANSNRNQNYFWDLRSMAYKKAPHMSIYEYDENGVNTGNYFNPERTEQGYGIDFPNPVALARDGINKDVKNRVLSKFLLQYEIVKGLRYSADVSFDLTDNNNKKLLPESATGVQIGNVNLNKSRSKEDIQNIIQTFNKLIFTPDFGKNHRLMLMGMFSTYEKSFSQTSLAVSGIPSYNLIGPGNIGVSNETYSGRSKIRTLSYLLNAHYVFNDRYIFSSGIRIDGDSRFGPNNRYGYFPSLSFAWRASSEGFLSDLKWLSDLKLRASYGENGFATQGSYAYLAKYVSATGYLGMDGIKLGNVELNNLKWEATHQFNYGLDLALFDYRVTVTFDYYDKFTQDIILNNLEIPSTSGFSSITGNWGAMTNKGWEFNLSSNVFRADDFNVFFDFNISHNSNIIEDIPENFTNETFSVENGKYARRIQVGDPVGSFYGFRYLGVFSTEADAVATDANGEVIINPVTGEPLPYLVNGTGVKAGDAIYEDINNDGNINELDIVYLGDANPQFYGGFGLTIEYKNWVLSSYFNYKVGQDAINETRMYNENMYTTDNQSTAVLRRWRKSGDVTDIPRAVFGQSRNWLGSDRFVEDASFLRMKSLTLSYDVPPQWSEKINVQKVKAFLTAYNILTITNYTGQDPEIGFNGRDRFAVGRDNSLTPPPVTLTFGLNVLF
ncbi:MAG: TonB-dependent receptor [Saprospiraceae bacterium]|nr:TonB-dependent receptor [Saprospiraceae bacterium]MCB9323989.1 TonB-dependent receptor [Lewinellaceae bacterium]